MVGAGVGENAILQTHTLMGDGTLTRLLCFLDAFWAVAADD